MGSKGQLGLGLVPDELADPAFAQAWADWLADRAERRLPRYTARAEALQLKRLAEMGPAAAVAALEWSIAQGYRGVFAPPAPVTGGTRASAAPAPKAPSTWELNKKLELVEGRLKELKNRSPGDHCSLADFLSLAEREEYGELIQRRKALQAALLRET